MNANDTLTGCMHMTMHDDDDVNEYSRSSSPIKSFFYSLLNDEVKETLKNIFHNMLINFFVPFVEYLFVLLML